MIRKLLKHELIDLFKKTILIFAIATGAIVMLLVAKELEKIHVIFNLLTGLANITVYLSIAAIIFNSVFYPVRRFHQSIHKNEGYLTHTLPVTTGQILISKFITALILLVVSILSVLLILFAMGNINFAIIKLYLEGVNPNLFVSILMMSYTVLTYYCFVVLLFIAALTIGHSSTTKKVLISVLSGLGIYLLQQMLGVIALVFIFVFGQSILENIAAGIIDASLILLIPTTAYMLLVIMEVVIVYTLLKKKLNLE